MTTRRRRGASPRRRSIRFITMQCLLLAGGSAQAQSPASQSNPLSLQECAEVRFGFEGFQLTNENDSFPLAGGDKEYTQGIRVAQAIDPTWLSCRLRGARFMPSASVLIGQNLYTPRVITSRLPLQPDRGFGAYNYLGAEFMATSTDGRSRYGAEVSVGIRGGASLARNAQGGLHSLQFRRVPKGWDDLPAKFGVYTRWQFERRVLTRSWADLTVTLPSLEVGNVRRAVGVNSAVRIGYRITGFPVDTIHPAAAPYVPPAARRQAEAARQLTQQSAPSPTGLEAAVQAGAAARYIRHTSLVTAATGNVSPTDVVYDFPVGGYLRCRSWQVSYLRVWRTAEFQVGGVDAHGQSFGTASLSYTPWASEGGSCTPRWLAGRWGVVPRILTKWARRVGTGLVGQLGMGGSFARRGFDVRGSPSIVGHLAFRRSVINGLAIGIEASTVTLDEGVPLGDTMTTRDLIVRQQLVTTGWQYAHRRAGALGIRAGVPWLTKARLEQPIHPTVDGAIKPGRIDDDFTVARFSGWMVGLQYVLPLADHLTIGVDVSRHVLGRSEGPFSDRPSWRKSAVFLQLGRWR